MRTLFKNMIKPLYYYLKNAKEREFLKICDKYGHYKRYNMVNDVSFLNFIIDVPDIPSFIWQFKEIFVEEIYKFTSDTQKPIIFDCGANIGLSCLYFKQIYPSAQIKAFEADPSIANVLKSNLFRNGISDVDIIEKAVWIDYNGVEFGCEGGDGGSVYLTNNRIKVGSVRLKDFLEKEWKVDFLKIDIEGAEYAVLMDCGGRLNNVENLFIEYHSWSKDRQKLSDILRLLERNRFRYFIDTVVPRKAPFINHGRHQKMDLQLNIYAVKDG